MSIPSNGLTVARRAGLVTRVAQDDLLILDSASNEVTSLTGPAAAVWRALEEQATVGSLEAATRLSEAQVAAAVTELSNAGLVELGGFDRRRFLQRSALVGAGAIGGVVVMQLPAAASVVSGGGTSYGPYDLGTILTSAIGAEPTTAGSTTPYSFDYYPAASATAATPTSFATTLSSFAAMSYYASTASTAKPRFDDTGTSSENSSIGPYTATFSGTAPYSGGASDDAVVGLNKMSAYYDVVVIFTSPATGTLSTTVSYLSGSSSHATGASTSVQLVNASGTVDATYTGATLASTTTTTAITTGGLYYVVISDAKSTPAQTTMFLNLSMSVTSS